MRLVDALVTTLRDWDLRYVFGVSGANIEHLHDAIHQLGGDRLSAVLTKTEIGAAFMADCRARTHNTLGVCCATSGGGMMNLSVGVAEAYAESVPLLALVGQVPSKLEGRGGFQDSSGRGRTVDALGMFRSMSKYAERIDSATTFWEKLRDAVVAALSGRPGPAVLLFARDAYELEVGPPPAWFPSTLAELRSPCRADPTAIAKLAELLREAKHPVLLLGTGVDRSTDGAAVRELAKRAAIPVVTTMANPGAFRQTHPLFLGVVGAAGHPSAHAYLNERADLIVAVGTGLSMMVRHPLAPALARVPVAVVNIDPDEALRAIDPVLVVEADAGAAFRALLERWHEAPFRHGEVESYVLTRYRPTVVGPANTEGALRASQALRVLEPTLGDVGNLLFDAGNCAATAIHRLSIPRGVTTTIALGMGGMGYAIAGAIGAQLGRSRRSMVITGDGSFLMHGHEVHTAVELGLPILFVVFNDGRHGMCVTRQRLFFDGRVECAEYAAVNVAAMAGGLGSPDRLWTGVASNARELRARLAEYAAIKRLRPGVLELRLGAEEMPPFSPFLDGQCETELAMPLFDTDRSAA
jgi:acetolactate synthase-1/2/3 large subunit